MLFIDREDMFLFCGGPQDWNQLGLDTVCETELLMVKSPKIFKNYYSNIQGYLMCKTACERTDESRIWIK